MSDARHTVVFLNGIAGAGKDTFVQMCINRHNAVIVHNHSSINCVRELLHINESDKRPETRKVLAEVGAALEAYNGFRSKRTAHDIFTTMARGRHSFAHHLHFVHVREPYMATAIHNQLQGQIPPSLLHNTKVVRLYVVAPPHVVRVLNNASDMVAEYGFSESGTANNYGADFVVHNVADLDNLQAEADRFIAYNEALHAPTA